MVLSIQSIDYTAAIPELPAPPYCLLHTARPAAEHRWTILGWDPARVVMQQTCDDPLEWLAAHAVPDTTIAAQANDLPVPQWMGLLTYEATGAAAPWQLPADAMTDPWDDLGAIWLACQEFALYDHATKDAWRVTWPRPEARCGALWSPDAPGLRWRDAAQLPPTLAADAYVERVRQLRAHIAAGDCYQANLAYAVRHRTLRPARELFDRLVTQNPAPMMGVLDLGTHAIVSSSPERLLQRRSATVTTQPIKGTRPRGRTAAADAAQRAMLEHSAKERAELAMIVDLLRNDLGRVAQTGSVRVAAPHVIDAYANVFHASAMITATVTPELSWGLLFRALLPGGSITGCPKEMAMALIAALERERRGAYCGSLGYIDVHGGGDWNIAIRTVALHKSWATYHVGSGIVFDSDPAAEFDETLAKGESMVRALA